MNDMVSYPPLLLTKKQVAYLLSTSEWGVHQLVVKNKLTEVSDGGKWTKFRLEDVQAFVNSLPEKHSGSAG